MTYHFYFIIRQNNHGWLKQKDITANSVADARKQLREYCENYYHRLPFHATRKAPAPVDARYWEFDNQLYSRAGWYDKDGLPTKLW